MVRSKSFALNVIMRGYYALIGVARVSVSGWNYGQSSDQCIGYFY